MLYRVFNNTTEVAEANGRWLYARTQAPEYDRKLGVPVNPQITSAWDYGKETLDGRIACQVPVMWSTEFGGLELELTDTDFPEVIGEV